MPRGRGHRAGLLAIGTELNIVPFLDMMTVFVLFLLVTITSFLSFTMLNASIPQLAPDASTVQNPPAKNKEQLLLMVRVTKDGYLVDPSVSGGATINRVAVPKKSDGYDVATLHEIASRLKERFKEETRVLLIAEPKIIYDDIIRTMDSLRERQPGAADLFPDVTLSIL